MLYVYYNIIHNFIFNPTTNISTSAMIVYASGAGITAAAGTRLALHLKVQITFNIFLY